MKYAIEINNMIGFISLIMAANPQNETQESLNTLLEDTDLLAKEMSFST